MAIASLETPIILAVSKAAFSPLPIPTPPTGTPGGIWTTDSKESKFAGELLEAHGTPITGFKVCAATTPGKAGSEKPATPKAVPTNPKGPDNAKK